MNSQRDHYFNETIGELDFILSMLMLFSKAQLSEANRQTLKHHAEDMIAAGNSILNRLIINKKQEIVKTCSELSAEERMEIDLTP